MILALRFIGLVASALVLGLAFCHVLELPGKMTLDGHEYIAVQQIYNTFGPVAAVLEPVAIIATAALAIVLRRRGWMFGLAVAAAVSLLAALIAWFALVSPVNIHWAAPPSTMPTNWQSLRDRWEYGHIVHAVLVFAGFVLLTVSILMDTRPARVMRSVRDNGGRRAA